MRTSLISSAAEHDESGRNTLKNRFQYTHRADRDAANQAAAVAAAIQANEEVLAPYLPIYGWADETSSVPPGHVRLFDREALVVRTEEAKRSGERVMQGELAKALKFGDVRRLAGAPSPIALRRLRTDFPHFSEVLDLIEQRASLARMLPGQVFSLPPLLLGGPPGIGKTAFSEALADCLHQPTKRVDIAAGSAGFALGGSHETWSGARHGAVWSLLQAPTASGVLLVEEVDKAADSNFPVLGALYSLLEPVSARQFQDEYMQIPIDASHLLIIGTCNDPAVIEPALRSRFRVVHVPSPSRHHMTAIAGSVYRQLRANRPWGAVFPTDLPRAVLEQLSGCTPRELSRLIEDAVGRAATSGRQHLLDVDINTKATGTTDKPKLGFI